MSDEGDKPEWSCIVPFLNRDVTYAYGVEFGQLYEQTKHEERVAGYYCLANQDQILLLLSRLGWHVDAMKPHDKDWFWLEASKP